MSTLAEIDCPRSDVDPWSDAFLNDPFPVYDALRRLGPVVHLDRYGLWAVTGFEQAQAVLSDPAVYSSAGGAGLPNNFKTPPWRPPSIILEADPPVHTKSRAILSRVLSPTVLRALRPAFEAEAVRMLAPLVERGRFDAQKDLADPYPVKVFPDALGLAPEGREHLVHYGDIVFASLGPENEVYRRAMAHAPTAVPWIREKCGRAALAPGSLGAAIYAAADSGEVTEDEAGLLVRSFLSAGVDTTMNGIGAAIHCLATHPDQFEVLVQEPSLARAAFDETLRYDSSAPFVFRTTTRAVDLFGTTVPRHEKVLVFLNAANRDPARFADPDRYDLRRKTGGHVGFGFGIHACVGQLVARLEAESVLSALARMVTSLSLDGTPVRRQSNGLRGFSSIPVRVTARPAALDAGAR
jgi:4-methoxybenzoate monooxygenase (O-demethylating)